MEIPGILGPGIRFSVYPHFASKRARKNVRTKCGGISSHADHLHAALWWARLCSPGGAAQGQQKGGPNTDPFGILILIRNANISTVHLVDHISGRMLGLSCWAGEHFAACRTLNGCVVYLGRSVSGWSAPFCRDGGRYSLPCKYSVNGKEGRSFPDPFRAVRTSSGRNTRRWRVFATMVW